jgi:hypothetical protein
VCLTAWNDNPDEIHEKEIKPEIVSLGSAIRHVFVVMIEQAGSVIENKAIYLAKGNHCLKRMPDRMVDSDHVCCAEGKRTPAELHRLSATREWLFSLEGIPR